jgi:hypothetical protein
MLLQGHSTRACQLPDPFTLEFENEGVTPCWPVIMVMDQGKTNPFGKREYAACIRNKEVITWLSNMKLVVASEFVLLR